MPQYPRTGLDAAFSKAAISDLAKTLDAWEQGHLVSGVGIFWATQAGDDPISASRFNDDGTDLVWIWEGDRVASVDGDDSDVDKPSWAVITSQTCDITGAGPGLVIPTVQTSPLRKLTGTMDPGQISLVKRGEKLGLVYVTNPPDDNEWAVDLRISTPVSKTVLSSQDPRSAFATEHDVLEFAERIALRARRAAIHDEISNTLVTKLRQLVKDAKNQNEEWVERVEQFRLLITRGTRLKPEAITVIAVLSEDLTDEQREPLRTWNRGERRRLLNGFDITVTSVFFRELELMKVAEYRDSLPLYVPELAAPTHW